MADYFHNKFFIENCGNELPEESVNLYRDGYHKPGIMLRSLNLILPSIYQKISKLHNI